MKDTIIQEEWDDIREEIGKDYEVSYKDYERFFRDLKIDAIKDKTVWIEIPPESFVIAQYYDRYKLAFTAGISTRLGYVVHVKFVHPVSPEYESKSSIGNEW